MMTTNSLGIYIHVPFCIRKCKYCDFLSFEGCGERDFDSFAKALCQEIKLYARQQGERLVDTIYIGGGTPSILPKGHMQVIMRTLSESFNILPEGEITIEANPASLSMDKLEAYRELGINRISIGIQSCDEDVLETLGRIHNRDAALGAFKMARAAGFSNISLDLMFGIPGQREEVWMDSVKECISLSPEHISLYSLQLEEGTPLYRQVCEQKLMAPTDEETDRRMYHEALTEMKRAGYMQYEISNTARAGFESRHNLRYWSYKEYLGFGPGASSFIEGLRYTNLSDMKAYAEAVHRGEKPVNAEEIQRYSLREEMGIYMFTGLRKTEGVDIRDFESAFGIGFHEAFDPEILQRNKGYLKLDGARLFLTDIGMDVSNQIMAEFV